VVGNIGVHRADHADVIDVLRGLVKEFTDLQTRFTVGLEFERRIHDVAGRPFRPQVFHRRGITVEFLERRLGIKRIDVARSTIHEQMDDMFGTRWEVQGNLARNRVAGKQVA